MYDATLLSRQAADLDAFVGVTSAFCLTVYNEPKEAVERTVASIVSGVLASRKGAGDAHHSACICIMVDGTDAADQEMLDWLQATFVADHIASGAEYDVHYSSSPIFSSQVHQRYGDLSDAPDLVAIRAVLCLKHQNRGKLHSHAIFFRDLCGWMQPDYCFQADAGTVIAIDVYAGLLGRMGREQDIGALAPCITTPVPNGRGDFLSTWQHMDFVMQKSLHWPFELAVGHLSVVPGQLSIFRWAALAPAPSLPGGREAMREEDSPVDGYLRGLQARGALEQIMYLAEDRIIGNEIVLRKGTSWRLEYSPECVAVTDACTSLKELMRQRRRWNNSSLACRLWLLGKVPGFLVRRDRSVFQKLRFAIAILVQGLLMVTELVAPAVAFSVAAVLIKACWAATSGFGPALQIACAASLSASLVVKRREVAPGEKRVVLVAALLHYFPGILFSSLLGLLILRGLPSNAVVLLITAGLLNAASVLLVFGRHIVNILRIHGLYFLSNIFIAPALSAYAILNLDDTSWGTKGLTKDHGASASVPRRTTTRTAVVLLWASANIMLAAIVLSVPGYTASRLNPVFEVACAVGALVAGVATLGLVWRRLRSVVGRFRRRNESRAELRGESWITG